MAIKFWFRKRAVKACSFPRKPRAHFVMEMGRENWWCLEVCSSMEQFGVFDNVAAGAMSLNLKSRREVVMARVDSSRQKVACYKTQESTDLSLRSRLGAGLGKS